MDNYEYVEHCESQSQDELERLGVELVDEDLVGEGDHVFVQE